MDGTRMGSRSSTRHGPAAVFSGPVRRWKKTWAPVSSSASTSHAASSSSSRILLYKWVPLAPAAARDEGLDEQAVPSVRYMPVSIVLAQRKEASKRADEEAEMAAPQSSDTDANGGEPAEKASEASDPATTSAEMKDCEAGSEEQVPVASVKEAEENTPASEEKPSTNDNPEVDVAMADEAPDEMEEAKPLQDEADEEAKPLEEGVPAPSDASTGNEAES